MEIANQYTFEAPASRVWDLLMNPAVIARCLPGCKRLDPEGPDRYRATLAMNVAAIAGTYEGTVAVSDQQPPHSYHLSVEGTGRPGFIKGSTRVTLTPEGNRTIVQVHGEVQVGGAIARVGQRLLGGVSRMMMDRFFECLAKEVSR